MNNVFGGNRSANILLAFCRTHTLAAGELASRLDVSERTVRNDIKQLNRDLESCASIEGGQGRYTLHVYDNGRFRQACARLLESDGCFNSPRNRMDYLFGRLMRAPAPLLTDDLAYEMSIGRTTLVGDLKKLRAELEPWRLSILGKTSKGLLLQGSESDVRQYVLENAYDVLYRDYPLDPEILDLVLEFFRRCPLEQGAQNKFIQFLTVMLDRFCTGHPLGELSPAFYRLTARPEFTNVARLVRQIAQFLRTEISTEETIFVLLPIIGMRTPADILSTRAIELDQGMWALKEKVFRQIRLEMDIQIKEPEFVEEFLYHLMFMLNRLRFHVRLKSPMLAELQEKYPLAWRMAGVAAQVIQSEYGVEMTQDEHSYLASYFSVFLEESGLKRTKPFRAAVVCGTGRVTARLVAAQLRRVLDSSAELSLFGSDRVTPELLARFDLIFTTVQLPFSTGLPVLYIREVFNEQELRHKIEKAKYWDQVDVPILDNNWFVMVGLLDESRFFPLNGAESYEQVLTRMAQALADQGQVDPDFPARLRAREEIGSTVFEHGVATPHAVQCAGNKLVLAVGAADPPIPHGDREIRAVFLMGLPETVSSDDALLIRVYEEIISITQDGEMLEKIATAGSFQALLRALYRQAN